MIDQQTYDLFCHGSLPDLYPFFSSLRTEDPVHWSQPLGSWILTRYADAAAALRDPRLSSQRVPVYMNQLPESMRPEMTDLKDHLANWLVMTDPPQHTRLRALMSKAFTPKAIQLLRPHIQQIVENLLDGIEGRDQFDAIGDFAYPLPATVISEMLGIPPQDRNRFRDWTINVNAFTGGGGLALAGIARQAQQSVHEATEYFNAIIAKRRETAGQDLISAMLRAEEQEDKLTRAELISTCLSLLIAGHETTTNLIANGLLALLHHPDQMQELRDHPEMIQSAVEEFLRYESPLQRQTRVALEDLEIGGKKIAKGRPVLAMLGAANRDPDQFPEPDRLIIDRADNRHIAFGSGMHFCIGAPLARLEAQIAIPALLRRLPAMKLADAPLRWRQNMSARGLEALPINL